MHASEHTPLNGNIDDEETGTNSFRKQRIYDLIRSESAREGHVDNEVARSLRFIRNRSNNSSGNSSPENSSERRTEAILHYTAVTTGIFVGLAWFFLAYKSACLLLLDDDTKSIHTLWLVYKRFILAVFRAKAKDLIIAPLNSFLFLFIPMAVQNGVITILASFQAARTFWIQECFALICQVIYGLFLYNAICIIAWYFLFAVADAIIPVDSSGFCGFAIIGVGSLCIGWLVQQRFIPELSRDRLIG